MGHADHGRNTAFTLIESLVVIAIIATLAAMLLPVFAKAHERARRSRSLSNLRQLAMAIQTYAGDNEDRRLEGAMVEEVPLTRTQESGLYRERVRALTRRKWCGAPGLRRTGGVSAAISMGREPVTRS